MQGTHGHFKKVVTFISGESESSAAFISGANRVAIEFPAFGTLLAAAAANAYVKVAKDEDDTFRRLRDMGVYSSTSGIQDWEIPSFTGDKMILCRPVVGFDHMKVELSTAATDGYTATVHILH